MGVSIAVGGSVASEDARRDLLAFVAARAEDLEWSVRRVDRAFKRAKLRNGGRSTTLEMARARGLSLLPHFACEELPLIFVDEGGALIEEVVETSAHDVPTLLPGVIVKTQFAGPQTHREICEVLNAIQQQFAPDLLIDDESGFAATGDAAALAAAFRDGWGEIGRKIVADSPGPGSTFQVGEFPFEVPVGKVAGELDSLNEKQREFLLACERAGMTQLAGFGMKIDRTREGVTDLELVISDVDGDANQRDVTKSEVQDVALMAGACFGRAVAAVLGGSWRVDDGQFLLTDVGRTGLVIDPFEVARDRIQNGPPYGFVNHLGVYEAIAANLARAPQP